MSDFHRLRRRGGAALAVWIGLALVACNDANDSRTAGQKLDSAIAKTENSLQGLKGEARLAGQQVKQAVTTLGDRIDVSATDARITASVKTALATDESLNALKIDVDTVDGKVSLEGTAPTAVAKERATTLAREVEGVVSVDNRLVVPAAGGKG